MRFTRYIRISVLAVFSLTVFSLTIHAKEVSPNLLKAAFIINFCKFVEWPESSFESEDSPIVVGIWNVEGYNELINRDSDYQAQNRRVEFKSVEDLGEDGWIHVLFVNVDDKRTAQKAIRNYSGKPVLTVGNVPNFAKSGGMINLVERGSRLTFKINLEQCKAHGLWVSSQLLALGKVVSSEEGLSSTVKLTWVSNVD